MPDPLSADAPADTQIEPAAPNSRGHEWSWPRFCRNAVIIALVGVFGAWYVIEGVMPNLFPKRFGVVVEGALYRSGELTPAATRKVVRERGIRTIVDLGAHEPGTIEERRAIEVAESLGVTRVRLDLEGDARGDPNDYVRALRIVADPDAGPVLVHCAAGSQRTGCAIGLFRMIEHGWTLEQVIDEARVYDHDPEDNPHLIAMIERWRGEIEAALLEERLINLEADGLDANSE